MKTINDIKKSLFDYFMTLNDFSKITFIDDNVALPNVTFTQPDNKQWFELYFISPEVDAVGMYDEAQDDWVGVLQIDICTPLDKGEDEPDNKYHWIRKLFSRGTVVDDDIVINKCYESNRTAETDHYRTTVRVEWEAVIDKE